MVRVDSPNDPFAGILDHGFLPAVDPLEKLPEPWLLWDRLGAELPNLIVSGRLRAAVQQMPVLSTAGLQDGPELERAMMLLSYVGHGFVWGESKPAERLPAGLAVPWAEIAERLHRPPVLSYASYALHNWKRMNPREPVALGNIVLLQNFLAGLDEEWFILIHIDIESQVIPALRHFHPLQDAAAAGHAAEAASHLEEIARRLDGMYQTLLRMPEHCDPYIYFHRVRPYLYGWKNQPALPRGIVYEGVERFRNEPQWFRGETGAQSTIVPALDAVLGIHHEDDPLKAYLMEMRDYMPRPHRRFLESLEQRPGARRFIHGQKEPRLRNVFNECVRMLSLFRGKHFEYAGKYIHQQAQQSLNNPHEVGTGGTPFMAYLKKHLQETESQTV